MKAPGTSETPNEVVQIRKDLIFYDLKEENNWAKHNALLKKKKK